MSSSNIEGERAESKIIAGASLVGVLRRWAPFLILSAFFFHVTAATFTSLGVVLPHMIAELGWSWSQAGLGFSLFALMVGLASLIPAWIIRRWGIKATFAVGGAMLALGFMLLATTQGLPQYYLGACLAGIGYPLCAIVPSVHYFNIAFTAERRAPVIGAYFTIGGLGGVAGPLLVTSIIEVFGLWRYHWWVLVGVTILLTMLALAFIVNHESAEAGSDASEGDGGATASAHIWTYKEVIRTTPYYVIVASMTLTLFCGLTMNSWAVTHMGALGVSGAIAAGALSAHALINAFARGVGGVLANRVDPKWLLVSALAAEVLGMLALAYADNPVMISLFAIGEGYGFGMCLFATTLLLVNYYGTANNSQLQGSMHFITTLAMIGPVAAGVLAELTGGFAVVFIGYAVLLLAVLAAAIVMRKPTAPTAA